MRYQFDSYKKTILMKLLFLFLLPFSLFAQTIPQPKQFKPLSTTKSHNYNPFQKSGGLQQLRNQQQQQIYLQNQRRIAQLNRQLQQRAIVYQKILAEMKQEEGSIKSKEAYDKIQQQKQSYFQNYQKLYAMLQNPAPVSVKQAVYLVESAYFQNKMKQSDFEEKVDNLVSACHYRMKQIGRNPTSYRAKLETLNELFADTIRKVVDGREFVLSLPPQYDFEDPFGHQDFTKQFVSKLMTTQNGQCHSLPLLYKILADELGVEAYLAYSPSHSYIKYKDEQGKFRNYETTNKHEVSNTWVMASGFVNASAVKSRVFMDSISNRKLVANCLSDLASGYIHQFGYDEFVIYCANTALKYYPESGSAHALKSNYITHDLSREFKKAKNPPLQNLAKTHPELAGKLEYLRAFYEKMDVMGYTTMADDDYTKWIGKPAK
jgi:rRNA maturation protein Nop10